MSQENVENVRRGYEHFAATGDFLGEVTADFVWDMSKFRGWPEQQTYEGVAGARVFLRDWLEAWDDWTLEVEALHDAGDKVVAIVRQRGQSKTSGLPVDMAFGQVWTIRNGKSARMECMRTPSRPSKPWGCRSKTLTPTPEPAPSTLFVPLRPRCAPTAGRI
jgi:ketosteroid isomerase-like protein